MQHSAVTLVKVTVKDQEKIKPDELVLMCLES